MPIIEYVCAKGHVTEKLYLTFKAAEHYMASHTVCTVCMAGRTYPNSQGFPVARRVEFSVPGPAILYGRGFFKPAASGKTQTVGRDVTKFIKEENITSATTESGEKFGVKHLEKAKTISKQIRRSRRT